MRERRRESNSIEAAHGIGSEAIRQARWVAAAVPAIGAISIPAHNVIDAKHHLSVEGPHGSFASQECMRLGTAARKM
jgi:hypothetical protein